MFDIPFHINLFIFLNGTSIKSILLMSRHSLPQLKDQTLLCLVISLIEVEHLLKTSNKRTQV